MMSSAKWPAEGRMSACHFALDIMTGREPRPDAHPGGHDD
jgi:hypothetical protein